MKHEDEWRQELHLIAETYEWAAYVMNVPPVKTVAEEFGLSYDVAAKRVQAARLNGFLRQTPRGKGATWSPRLNRIAKRLGVDVEDLRDALAEEGMDRA